MKLFIRDKILGKLMTFLIKLAYILTPYECERIYIYYPPFKNDDEWHKFNEITERAIKQA